MKLERRDPRLPPPSKVEDSYTIGLLGSEGSSYTPVLLTRTQLQFLLRLEDRLASDQTKRTGFYPEMAIFRGGVRNIGTTEEPVWEPKGERVRRPRI